jgi:hypothetical protein
MKTSLMALTLVLGMLVPRALSGAGCSKCSFRAIQVYDFAISMTAPKDNSDPNLVNAYFVALKYAPALAGYIATSDPNSSCFVVTGCAASATLTKDQVTANVPVMGWMAGTLPHGASGGGGGSSGGGSGSDYTITGQVSGSGSVITITYSIAARNSDNIATITSQLAYDFPATDLAAQVAVDMQGGVGSLLEKFLSYEKKKREEGDPYAINPETTLKPEKTVLAQGDSTTIQLEFKDCDGVALKNRKVTVKCSLGKLDKSEYATDENGEATIRYTTVGIETGIDMVEASVKYLEPWAGANEEKRTATGAASINVAPLADSWCLSGFLRYDERTTSSMKMESAGMHSSSSASKVGKVRIGYWLKRTVLPRVPGDATKYYFVADGPDPISGAFTGGFSESGEDQSLISNEGGYVQDEGAFRAYATGIPKTMPKEAVTIDYKRYTFSFTNLDAKRSGKFRDVSTVYIKGQMEPTVENSTTDADSSAALDWSVQDVSRDTSYTVVSAGDGTSSRKTVTQKCKWDDTSEFWLEYSARFDETSNTSVAGVTEQTTKARNVDIILVMFYNKNGAPNAVAQQPPPHAPPLSSRAVLKGVRDGGLVLYDCRGRRVPPGAAQRRAVCPGLYIISRPQGGGTNPGKVVISR